MNFPKRLKQLRMEKGLYQKEIANRIGVSRPTITQYETGTRTPDHETLQIIADYFAVSVDYLLGRTDERNPASKIKEKYESQEAEIEELMDRFNVHLNGEVLTSEDKQNVIVFLKMLRDRKN